MVDFTFKFSVAVMSEIETGFEVYSQPFGESRTSKEYSNKIILTSFRELSTRNPTV